MRIIFAFLKKLKGNNRDLTDNIIGRRNNLYMLFNLGFLMTFVGVFKVFKRTSIRLTGVICKDLEKENMVNFI